jgi:hypothetical protein
VARRRSYDAFRRDSLPLPSSSRVWFLRSTSQADPDLQKRGPAALGAATTFYTVSPNITGGAPCGTSAVSQVLGFPANASGAASPTLTITSPNTVDRYSLPRTDAAGYIYVYSHSVSQECVEVVGSEKILVFAPVTRGTFTAAPIRAIAGPATQLFGAGFMAVDGAGDIYLWDSQGAYAPQAPSTIIEFAAGASGNVAPIRTINLPSQAQLVDTQVGYPEGLAVDGSGNIVFAESNSQTVSGVVSAESDTIEVFTPEQTGNATPARTISGPLSQLTQISGLALDGAGNIYVEMATVVTGADPTILEFAGGANATASAAPINRISGTQTMLSRFFGNGLTVDGPGNIYVLDYTFPYTGTGMEPSYILRFGVGATGNAVPTAALLASGVEGAATH